MDAFLPRAALFENARQDVFIATPTPTPSLSPLLYLIVLDQNRDTESKHVRFTTDIQVNTIHYQGILSFLHPYNSLKIIKHQYFTSRLTTRCYYHQSMLAKYFVFKFYSITSCLWQRPTYQCLVIFPALPYQQLVVLFWTQEYLKLFFFL